MSKSILVTGGAGFIGHQVVKEIIASSDWNIYLIDRLSYAGDLNRINEIIEESDNDIRKRIKFIFHDLKAPLNNQVLKQNSIRLLMVMKISRKLAIQRKKLRKSVSH